MVTTRSDRAWEVLAGVLDPEVPALSVRDLGIVRDVIDHGEELEVVLTPTYSGCPATEVIESSVLSAIEAEGLGPARATLKRAPAWTTDWMSEEGKRKLREYGIAPPHACAEPASAVIRIVRRDIVPCPRCGSKETERISAFGSTACKALYRCVACREPFEYFKPL
ncbi:MAG TPA: 1,2-phenylacetyl-CoA epoxidase subunit PaaD [Ramlibacter sp.]|uniref:1,2-phenylacetyl-CoA epoxidase subunit PaaD n=1 Tax=Ramlibacter sp. TaxID=1917967 RepID=UPI002C53815A|nr:1,2-phenylacetyl-CoA epoxidase subunit PaaD [Ramlibacter sp.]HVZ46016.1 1,2-phenylacetyl-CoA epoxidase subunit PaaD [Ramlibacter sp.]